MSALQQFHFLRPAWLLALALLPPLLWWLSRRGDARHELARLADAELLPHLLSGRGADRRLPLLLAGLGALLAVLALAGPSWSRAQTPLYADRAAQVVAVALSPRMLARDVAPSRLDRARYKARALFDANRDGLNGLVAYAGEAFVVAPLTSDAHSLDDLLDALAPDTMPVDGDNAAAAIERGVELIDHAHAGGGSLVLLADRVDAGAEAAARKALAAGVRVSVLGVGSAQGGPVPQDGGGFLHDAQGRIELARRDDAGLAALAAAGGGRYVPLRDDAADVEALRAELRAGTAQASGEQGAQWEDRGPWLLLPLLLVAACGFRRGWLLVLPLLALPLLPGRAEAASWRDLWQRRDQQAAQALREGRAKEAAQLARDPALRGAAAYRAGDYAAAAQALAGASGADARYNLGNALARMGRYREAIAAYDEALRLDPAHADARANRQAVEDWLRRQPPPSQKAQDGQGGGQDQRDQDKQGKNAPSKDAQDGHKQDSQGNRRGEQADGQPDDNGQGGGQNGQPGESASGQDAKREGAAPPPDAGEQARQAAQAEQARQALQRQMDRALRSGRPAQDDGSHQLGVAAQDDPEARLPAELRQALQRVPDDPGALLRRKFELEYRQRHGAPPGEDDTP